MKILTSSLLGLVFSLFINTLTAAESTEEEASAVDEVVVTGIKKSLQDSIDIKRSYVGVMDAITAEDFGKFPDGNLAESLARVAGVGIDRSNVEGERVAVRGFGPEFNLVTLNGRQMPTVPGQWEGGRSFNFGDIASPGIQAVEIFKATNSSLPSGGIGSTINMVTTKPLSVEGTRKSFSINIVNDTTSKEASFSSNKPIETSFLFATNQDTWGFSFSGSYQDRNNREEGTREANWLTVEKMAAIEGYSRVSSSGSGIINNSARTDGFTFYQEPTAYQIKDNDRVRTNAQATFQVAHSDNLTSTLDYTYSAVDFNSEGLMFGSWLGGWDTQQGIINSRGVYTDVTVANRSYDHQLIWGSTKNLNQSLGLNIDWQINDSLVISLDTHQSSASKTGSELPNEMGFTTDIKGTLTHKNAGNSGINTFSYDTAFEPSNYLASSVQMWDAYKDNELEQTQIEGSWTNLNGGIITSIDFGVSTIENTYLDARAGNGNGAINPLASQYDDSMFHKAYLGNFMNSFSANFGTDYYYNIDRSSALKAFVLANGAITAGDLDTNERVNEDLNSAFLQVNMETEYMGMPLNIVAGVRYEESETESISLEEKPTTIRWDFINGLTYVGNGIVDAPRYGENDIILPSLALSLGISDSQVLRFSYSESMARASLQDLRSQLSYGNTNYLSATASGGNPNLEPLKASNFDISYENYYAEGSYFAVNYFKKEIEDFIGSKTVNSTIDGLTDPTQSAIGQYAINCVNEWAAAGSPGTAAGDPSGVVHCTSQQALWAQPWMNNFQHMAWVALAMQAHDGALPEFWNVYWAQDAGMSSPNCNDGGWWRCNPGYIDGQATDPLATFAVTRPYNKEEGSVDGFEIVLQHLFEGTPYGVLLNATKISGGDADVDRNLVGEQFLLDGLGDSGNFSVFYEDDKHTARLALNYRGETVAGFGNYDQPLFVEERMQIDASYQYRWDESTTLFIDAMNINDESTRLHARYEEMLFLSQDHGPVYKIGFRTNF